jgi:hypothetical protein
VPDVRAGEEEEMRAPRTPEPGVTSGQLALGSNGRFGHCARAGSSLRSNQVIRGTWEVDVMANRDGRKREGRSVLEKRRDKREKQQATTVTVRARKTRRAS